MNLVLLGAARWAGLAVALAVAAVLIAVVQARTQRPGPLWPALAPVESPGTATPPAVRARRRWIRVLTLAVLAAGGALAPLNLARLHSMAQLSRHSAFGIFFAAAAGGYALAWLSRVIARLAGGRLRPAGHRAVSIVAGTLVLAAVTMPAAIAGTTQAAGIYAESPDSAALITSLRSLTAGDHGRYLAENSSIEAYYLAGSVPWRRWRSTAYFSYVPPGTATTLTGPAAYRAALRRHYFSLIVLSGTGTPGNDAAILASMTAAGPVPDRGPHRRVHHLGLDPARPFLPGPGGARPADPARAARAVSPARAALRPREGQLWPRLSERWRGPGRHRRYGLSLPDAPTDEGKTATPSGTWR